MTREERCWADLCKRLQRDPATSEESDTCTLRVAFKHAIAFADAEAAAMRERAVGHMRARAEELRAKSTNLSTGAMMYAIYMEEADKIAALPATGEVGRG